MSVGSSCPAGSSTDPAGPVSRDAAGVDRSDSRQLKFGMERILSEDISPTTRIAQHSHQTGLAAGCATGVPCAECVSSLLRCCRLGSYTPYHGSYYAQAVHAPRPIRPYTNHLLVSDGGHVSPADRSAPTAGGSNKRKRSWSRAVFSNLQRKGLEKRFQLQKYITKPDRRQLAATLGLTDAQVKVWFQNRRMKWRHSKEAKLEVSLGRATSKEDPGTGPDSTQEPEIDVLHTPDSS